MQIPFLIYNDVCSDDMIIILHVHSLVNNFQETYRYAPVLS